MKLQLGNLVYECRPEGKEIIEVEYISKFFINGTGISAIKPIPITEEWLLKFGFVIRDKSYSLNYGGESMRYAMLEKSNTPLFMLFFHGRFGFNTEEGRKNGDYCIQYVHQLQNLHFALTGEELIFNTTQND